MAETYLFLENDHPEALRLGNGWQYVKTVYTLDSKIGLSYTRHHFERGEDVKSLPASSGFNFFRECQRAHKNTI